MKIKMKQFWVHSRSTLLLRQFNHFHAYKSHKTNIFDMKFHKYNELMKFYKDTNSSLSRPARLSRSPAHRPNRPLASFGGKRERRGESGWRGEDVGARVWMSNARKGKLVRNLVDMNRRRLHWELTVFEVWFEEWTKFKWKLWAF